MTQSGGFMPPPPPSKHSRPGTHISDNDILKHIRTRANYEHVSVQSVRDRLRVGYKRAKRLVDGFYDIQNSEMAQLNPSIAVHSNWRKNLKAGSEVMFVRHGRWHRSMVMDVIGDTWYLIQYNSDGLQKAEWVDAQSSKISPIPDNLKLLPLIKEVPSSYYPSSSGIVKADVVSSHTLQSNPQVMPWDVKINPPKSPPSGPFLPPPSNVAPPHSKLSGMSHDLPLSDNLAESLPFRTRPSHQVILNGTGRSLADPQMKPIQAIVVDAPPMNGLGGKHQFAMGHVRPPNSPPPPQNSFSEKDSRNSRHGIPGPALSRKRRPPLLSNGRIPHLANKKRSNSSGVTSTLMIGGEPLETYIARRVAAETLHLQAEIEKLHLKISDISSASSSSATSTTALPVTPPESLQHSRRRQPSVSTANSLSEVIHQSTAPRSNGITRSEATSNITGKIRLPPQTVSSSKSPALESPNSPTSSQSPKGSEGSKDLSEMDENGDIETNSSPTSSSTPVRTRANSTTCFVNSEQGGRVKLHRCKECAKLFPERSKLKRHLRIDHGKSNFICRHCSRAFSDNHNLIRHMRTHTGEKPFKCTKCGKGFSQKGSMQKHSIRCERKKLDLRVSAADSIINSINTSMDIPLESSPVSPLIQALSPLCARSPAKQPSSRSAEMSSRLGSTSSSSTSSGSKTSSSRSSKSSFGSNGTRDTLSSSVLAVCIPPLTNSSSDLGFSSSRTHLSVSDVDNIMTYGDASSQKLLMH